MKPPYTRQQLKAMIRAELRLEPTAKISLDFQAMHKKSRKSHGWFYEFSTADVAGIAAVSQGEGSPIAQFNVALFQ